MQSYVHCLQFFIEVNVAHYDCVHSYEITVKLKHQYFHALSAGFMVLYLGNTTLETYSHACRDDLTCLLAPRDQGEPGYRMIIIIIVFHCR